MTKSENSASLILSFSNDGFLAFNFSSSEEISKLVHVQQKENQHLKDVFKEPLLSKILSVKKNHSNQFVLQAMNIFSKFLFKKTLSRKMGF